MSKIIRTPANRFENLVGYNFQANYVEVADGLKMHYVDEGGKDKPIVLLLHGEPSWSYLYRKMIPILVEKGYRTIAPDLIGFGKSDKLTEQSDYTFQTHIEWMTAFLDKLELDNIYLFCQDWGGLIGLRVVANMSDRFSKIVASNTGLPIGKREPSKTFLTWREFSQKSPHFDIGGVINMGTVQSLSEDVLAAYNAPFPSEEYKAGARIFPSLVPISLEQPEAQNNAKAWKVLSQWEKPFLTIFGDADKITAGAEKVFQRFYQQVILFKRKWERS